MRYRTRGGPCGGRTYDDPDPLPAAIAFSLPDGRHAYYALTTWQKTGPGVRDVEPVYTYERTA